MEPCTLTNSAVKKQLFLKKSIIVKFTPVTQRNRLDEKRNDMETTTSGTLPTTSIIYTTAF
jgi:hypothetical protein